MVWRALFRGQDADRMLAWLDLLLFMVLLLSLSLYGLAASGHFPREHRSASLQTAAGTAILLATIGTAVICLAAGLLFVWSQVPWYADIIGSGLAILAAPLVFRALPARFIDGRAALLVFSGLALVLALAMLAMT